MWHAPTCPITQDMYQMLDPCFVGLIFSVFNSDGSSHTNKVQVGEITTHITTMYPDHKGCPSGFHVKSCVPPIWITVGGVEINKVINGAR